MTRAPRAQAICLEQVSSPPALGQPAAQCVALPGDEPGLGLDAAGEICWQRAEADLACELFVAADGRLALMRREGAPAVRLEREGRGLELEPGKPTFVLTGDLITVGSRQLRVFLHGEAPRITPPTPVEVRDAPPVVAPRGPGEAVGIEVRERPPKVSLTGGGGTGGRIGLWIVMGLMLAAAGATIYMLLLR